MRFFLDHDVPRLVGEALARHEHEVLILSEHLPVTSTDEEVFAFAIAGGLIMVTCNRDDFLALATTRDHPGADHPDPEALRGLRTMAYPAPA